MEATVVLFIVLYKVIKLFESVDETLKCDHSNESYSVVLSCGTVYYYCFAWFAWSALYFSCYFIIVRFRCKYTARSFCIYELTPRLNKAYVCSARMNTSFEGKPPSVFSSQSRTCVSYSLSRILRCSFISVSSLLSSISTSFWWACLSFLYTSS